MYTNQAPLLLDTLRQVAGSEGSAQALQAFANCNADLGHRGPVTLAAQKYPNVGGVMSPASNGGGVTGVSRGSAGGFGQTLRGGVYVPDATDRLPPWGLGQGVGSGYTFPTSSYYGGNYYGANEFGYDLQTGAPTSAYLLSLNQGGDYYDNSSYHGGGTNLVSVGGPNIYFPPPPGGYRPSDWTTVFNNLEFSFPTTVTNVSNFNYGGPSLSVYGDTTINNWPSDPGNPYPPPQPGRDGRDGDPGLAGQDGAAGRAGDPGPAGRDGRDGIGGGGGGFVPPLRSFRFVYFSPNGKNAPSVKPDLQITTAVVSVPTTASLDPDTCQISLGGLVNTTVVTKVEPLTTNIDNLIRNAAVAYGP